MSKQARLIFAVVIFAAAIVFPPACVPGQTNVAKTPSTGTISGRVTVGGKAAPNVPVAAYSVETANRRTPAARAVTDNEGRYRLSGLPPSQYQITSLSPELAAEDKNPDNFAFVSINASKQITLAAGEEVNDIDLRLVKGAVITGRVTDANNKPVVEERVRLLLVDENGNQLRNTRTAWRFEMYQTDDRGIYRIYGLAAGRYKVSVGIEPGGGMNDTRGYYARTFYPDTPDQMKARVVEVTEGSEATGIDIQLGRPEETYKATGRVMDAETGQPLPGVRLSYLVGVQNPGNYSPFTVGNPTGPRGEFQLTGLSPGHYGAYLSPEFQGGDFYSEVAYFDVSDKDVTGVEVKARRGSTLSGFVVVEGDGQRVATAQNPRLRILATATQSAPTQERNSGAATVGPDGSFRISGLKAGRFSLYVYPISASLVRPTIARIERDGVAVTQGLELQAGQSANDLRVLINYGTGAIRGTVRFSGGQLTPDMRVAIRCHRDGARDVGANLDSRGSFLIKDLAPGTYEVTVHVYLNMNLPGTRQPSPQKQFVQVNDGESEVAFVVDLTPGESP